MLGLLWLTVPSKIYRCWTVYGYSWRVVWLPIIFWLGSLTCAILMLYADIFGTAETTKRIRHKSAVLNFDAGIGFYSINIVTNLFTTGMTTIFYFAI